MLVAGLHREKADAWQTLAEIDADFRVRPHAEDDCVWPDRPGHVPYPDYGARIERARTALSEVGAVTPAYHWMQHRPPTVGPDGQVGVADAIRLATTIVRAERFGDGNIGAAVANGTLQAVVAALAAWGRSAADR